MDKPHKRPDSSGQSQTMIYTEGNPVAALVTTRGGKTSAKHPRFSTADLAFEWCRKHRCKFFWMPATLEGN